MIQKNICEWLWLWCIWLQMQPQCHIDTHKAHQLPYLMFPHVGWWWDNVKGDHLLHLPPTEIGRPFLIVWCGLVWMACMRYMYSNWSQHICIYYVCIHVYVYIHTHVCVCECVYVYSKSQLCWNLQLLPCLVCLWRRHIVTTWFWSIQSKKLIRKHSSSVPTGKPGLLDWQDNHFGWETDTGLPN